MHHLFSLQLHWELLFAGITAFQASQIQYFRKHFHFSLTSILRFFYLWCSCGVCDVIHILHLFSAEKILEREQVQKVAKNICAVISAIKQQFRLWTFVRFLVFKTILPFTFNLNWKNSYFDVAMLSVHSSTTIPADPWPATTTTSIGESAWISSIMD